MRKFHCFPAGALRGYVERIWGWEADPGEKIALPTILPGTGAEMFFHYRAPFQLVDGKHVVALDNAHLLCVRHRTLSLAKMKDVGFVAIRFKVGALHHFVPFPGQELIDQQPAASDLWGSAGKELAKRICHSGSNQARVALLQSFLMDRLHVRERNQLVRAAATRLYRNCDSLSITNLASQLGVSRRYLERQFLAVTGQTPVELRRLSRFQKTARSLLLCPARSSSAVALDYGYYDQSHFLREFRSIAAMSPSHFLAQSRFTAHFYNDPGHGRRDDDVIKSPSNVLAF